jgi:ubiquinone/menaquinone biosynthesis C-methylase UbiE
MPTEKEVYAQHAKQYEHLIQREDFQNNIIKAIQQIIPLNGLEIADLGAGTGRLTRLLSPLSGSVITMDLSPQMLLVAKDSLKKAQTDNWLMAAADNAHLPVKSSSIDLVISGWSFCYLAVWGGETWKTALQNGLAEIKRILRKNSTIIILETMGTGFETPNPPPHLANYFGFLEEMDFSSTWIRTDYQFESLAEAEELSSFFFGKDLAAKVKENQWVILPECTGVWWLKING